MNRWKGLAVGTIVALAGAAVSYSAFAGGQKAQGETAQGEKAEASSAARDVAIATVARGQVVRLSGEVVRVVDRDEFRLADESGSISIRMMWSGPAPVAVGDRVTVTGIVDAYTQGGILREVYAREITLADGTRVDLQTRREAIAPTTATQAKAPAGPVVAIDTVRRGQNVVLSGVVHRIRDTDEFILRDDTGSITIYIGWRNRMPVAAGDRVKVMGVADDDLLPGMRPEIYASSIVLADGRRVELVRGGRDE